ncbi:MFS-type transporter clz9-like [Cryptomeria japonica]|uniref:MFS-type transporter clz9-like n=1 Tax=Cryptomeria japonica TaxID=3369 RepID=UPI0027DAB3B6|nr:MFS-type transporter clz9-like [Cryptomeria japonica]
MRIVEGVDSDRAIMLRPSIVASFYDNLELIYNLNHYGRNRIWNFDETGVQAGRNCGMRVIAKLGQRCVPHLISKSKEWITVLACVSACGFSIPRFYLFKSKRHIRNYIANCELGACMAVQEHAWMTKELFLNWLEHFAHSVPGGVPPSHRALLIFDGHGSHVAFRTIEEARQIGIDLVTLLAHTSHKLQPLDVSVFSPFKNYFKQQRSRWMSKFPHIEIGREELETLASKAFAQALPPANIISGFRRTGIWPLNQNALENDMRPSEAFEVRTEHDAASRDEEPEYMAVEACLQLAGFNEEQIQDFVELHTRTQATVEGTSLTPEIAEAGPPPQTSQPNEGFKNTSTSMSLPTQADIPKWTQDAANYDDETLSMPSLPEIDPADVIHYFTNAVN